QSITAVRRIDHDSDGGSVIEHWRLSTPERAADLLDAWGDLSTVISCVAASCLTDQDWTRAWLPLLRERTWLVCLIDIELERLVPLWQDHPVRLRRLKAIDATGDRHVLMIQAGAPATDWLVVTNEIGAGLLEDGLEHHPDLCVEVVRDLAQEREREIGVLLTHLLATESFFDLRAWQRYDHPPIGKGMLR
ncbi:MAG: hypothetical protein FWF28_11210, partial [Micrococcales bacterium]|nr:hypothetical protein [Micrococcales bacterium]